MGQEPEGTVVRNEGSQRHGPIGEQLHIAVGLRGEDAEDGLGDDVVVVPVVVESAVPVGGEDGGQALLAAGRGCLGGGDCQASGQRAGKHHCGEPDPLFVPDAAVGCRGAL